MCSNWWVLVINNIKSFDLTSSVTHSDSYLAKLGTSVGDYNTIKNISIILNYIFPIQT